MHCLRLASTGKEPKFYAAAETPEELKLWIEVIKRAIVEVGGEAAAAVPSTSASAASPGSLNRIRSTLSRTINRMSSMSSVKAAGAAATASTDNVVASNASIASSLSNAERAEREQTPTRGQSRLADLATAAVEDGSAAASQKQQRKASTVSFKAQAVASEAAKESASGKDGSTNDDGDVFQSAVPSRTNSNARPIPSVATSMPLTPVKPAARRSRVMTILRISVNLIALVVMVLAVAKGLGFDVDPIRRVVLERVDEARAWTEGAVYDVRKLKDNVVYDVSKWTDDVVYDVRTWTEDVVYDVRTWKDAAAYDAWIWTDAVKHDLRKRSDDVAYDVRIWTDTMLYNLGAFIERQASYLHSSTATFRRGLTAEWTLLCKHFDRAANSIYSAGEDVIVWLWHVVHGVFVAAYDLQQALLTKVQDVVLKVRTFV